jgi:hypothetical protein
MIGTPSAGIVHAAYASSLIGMCLHYLTHPILGREKEPKHMNMLMMIGSSIGENRDKIVNETIKSDLLICSS